MDSTDTSFDASADRLERSTVSAGAAVAVVVGLAVMLFSIWVGLAVGIVGVVAWVLYVRSVVSSAPARFVASTGARRVAEGEFPRLDNLLDGLGVTSGVAGAKVWILDDRHLNAAVTADRDSADLVLTTGLVEGLGRLELEGVLANLLGRVRDGSARFCTVALALPGGRGRRSIDTRLGDQWPIMTDLAAVDLTRYPPALSSALSVMAASGTEVNGASGASSVLWLAPPQGDNAEDPAPLALRSAVLDEL